jgi:hypothetical protein
VGVMASSVERAVLPFPPPLLFDPAFALERARERRQLEAARAREAWCCFGKRVAQLRLLPLVSCAVVPRTAAMHGASRRWERPWAGPEALKRERFRSRVGRTSASPGVGKFYHVSRPVKGRRVRVMFDVCPSLR